jgi:hypothetical protein
VKKRFAKSNRGGLWKAIDGKILEVSARYGDVAAPSVQFGDSHTVRHLAGVGPLAEATGTSHRYVACPFSAAVPGACEVEVARIPNVAARGDAMRNYCNYTIAMPMRADS